jgi:hypothetical protein
VHDKGLFAVQNIAERPLPCATAEMHDNEFTVHFSCLYRAFVGAR